MAVIVRTLYTGLGPRGWVVSVTGLGGKQLHRLVAESRVPARIVASRVRLEAPPRIWGPVYVVDNRGRPAWELGDPPGTLVVDYAGFYQRSLESATLVSAAGFPSKTYEAVAVVYEFFLRRRGWGPRVSEAYSVDPRSGLYLARKALEALRVFDNYPLLEPNTIVYTVRRVYMRHGLLIDPDGYSIAIDPVEGRLREEIRLKAYTRRGLRERGIIEAVFDGERLEVRDWEGLRYRIVIDASAGRACAAPELCTGRGLEEAEAGEPLEGLGEAIGEQG